MKRLMKGSMWEEPSYEVIIGVILFVVIAGFITAVVVTNYALYEEMCNMYPEMCGRDIGFSASATNAAKATYCAIEWSVKGEVYSSCFNVQSVGGGIVDSIPEEEVLKDSSLGTSLGINNPPSTGGFLFAPMTESSEEIQTNKISFQSEDALFDAGSDCEFLMPHFIYDDGDFGTDDIYYYFDSRNREWVWRCPGCTIEELENAVLYERFRSEVSYGWFEIYNTAGLSYFRFGTENIKEFYSQPEFSKKYKTVAEGLSQEGVINSYEKGLEVIFNIVKQNGIARIEYVNGPKNRLDNDFRDNSGNVYSKIQELLTEIEYYPKICGGKFSIAESSTVEEKYPTVVECWEAGKKLSNEKDFSVYDKIGTSLSRQDIIRENSFFTGPRDFGGCIVRNINMPQVNDAEAKNVMDIRIAGYGDPDFLIYWQNFPAEQDTWTYKEDWKLAATITLVSSFPLGTATKVFTGTKAALGTSTTITGLKLIAERQGTSLAKRIWLRTAIAGAIRIEGIKQLTKHFSERIALYGVTKVVVRPVLQTALVFGTIEGSMLLAALVDSYNTKYNVHGNSIVLKEPYNKELYYELSDDVKGIPILTYWDPGYFDATKREPFHMVSPCSVERLEVNYIKADDKGNCVMCKPYTYTYDSLDNEDDSAESTYCNDPSIFKKGENPFYRCNTYIPTCSLKGALDKLNIYDILGITSGTEEEKLEEAEKILFNNEIGDVLKDLGVYSDIGVNDYEDMVSKYKNDEEIRGEVNIGGTEREFVLHNVDVEEEIKHNFDTYFESISLVFQKGAGTQFANREYRISFIDINSDGTFDSYGIDPECRSDFVEVQVKKLKPVERGYYNYCHDQRTVDTSILKWTGITIATAAGIVLAIPTGGASLIPAGSTIIGLSTTAVSAISVGAGMVSAYNIYKTWDMHWPGVPAGNAGGPPVLRDEKTT